MHGTAVHVVHGLRTGLFSGLWLPSAMFSHEDETRPGVGPDNDMTAHKGRRAECKEVERVNDVTAYHNGATEKSQSGARTANGSEGSKRHGMIGSIEHSVA